MEITTKKESKKVVIKQGDVLQLHNESGPQVTFTGLDFQGYLSVKNAEGKTELIDPISIFDVILAIQKVVPLIKESVPFFKAIWGFIKGLFK